MRTSSVFRDPLYLCAVIALIAVAAVAGGVALGDGSSADAGPQARTSPTARATEPTATRTAAPAATATPSYGDVLMDTQRLLALAAARDALESFYAARGSYPSTNGASQTLCSSQADAGCQLRTIAPGLEATDGENPFWYRSDGAGYTLFARVAIPPAENDCPATLPAELEGNPVACISGDGSR
jgi:hypothetical protein